MLLDESDREKVEKQNATGWNVSVDSARSATQDRRSSERADIFPAWIFQITQQKFRFRPALLPPKRKKEREKLNFTFDRAVRFTQKHPTWSWNRPGSRKKEPTTTNRVTFFFKTFIQFKKKKTKNKKTKQTNKQLVIDFNLEEISAIAAEHG